MATSSDDAVGGGMDAAGRRNLVVDESAFEEQFLRCHICQERFDQTEKMPKSLPCNHTFCLPCLIQVFDHNQGNARRAYTFADDSYEGVLKCPTCRVEIFLSRGEINALPNDHRVIQMMDFLSQVAVKSQNVCSKHENQPLNFFCKSCMVPVCRDCTVLDHKEQGSQAHVIVDVSAAMNDNAEDFNNVENRSKQLLQSMKTRSDALANASKQLDLLERVMRQQIKDTFIEYRLLLERRQEGQIAILHDMIKNQKGLINARFVDVCTQGSKLQKLYDQFTKARPTNDINKIFKVHNEMKEHEEQFSAQADANDDELFVACQFEVTNEPLFLSEMSCLGEVTQRQDLELKKPIPPHKLLVIDNEDRRIQAEAQMPDPSQLDCDDLMVTHVEQSSRSRERMLAERVDRLARLRARINHREQRAAEQPRAEPRRRDIDQDEDEAEEMEQDPNEMITSSYLLRIASRLNESSANLSEAILDLSTDRDQSPDDMPTSTSSSTSHGAGGSGSSRRQGSGPSPPRSRRSSANVRVVRHPQNARAAPDRSDRYIATRYDRRTPEQH